MRLKVLAIFLLLWNYHVWASDGLLSKCKSVFEGAVKKVESIAGESALGLTAVGGGLVVGGLVTGDTETGMMGLTLGSMGLAGQTAKFIGKYQDAESALEVAQRKNNSLIQLLFGRNDDQPYKIAPLFGFAEIMSLGVVATGMGIGFSDLWIDDPTTRSLTAMNLVALGVYGLTASFHVRYRNTEDLLTTTKKKQEALENLLFYNTQLKEEKNRSEEAPSAI